MKLNTITTCALALAPMLSMADVTVTFDKTFTEDKAIVAYMPISKMLTATNESEIGLKSDTIAINDGQFIFKFPQTEAHRYIMAFPDSQHVFAQFFAAPNEEVNINVIRNNGNIETSISGTPLLDGLDSLQKKVADTESKLIAIQQGRNTEDDFNSLLTQYYAIIEQFIIDNPNHPAAAYALLNIDSSKFMQLYNTLGEGAKQSLYFPFVEKSKVEIEQQLEAERRQQEMQNGTIDAPNFSLPGLNGEVISLSDFRGKWVVLDFWGSWCGWCIKGFPKMKEAYAKHKDKVEFIGIDCGDSIEDWKAAVAKYQIPWVNVYNDTENVASGRPDQTYLIQGYPTKIIINPEGKIYKIVTGEDPKFYTDLDELLK